MKQKRIFIVTVVVLLAAFVAAALLFQSRQADRAAVQLVQNREALVRFHSPSLGEPDAPVHIVEFFDPACETCRDFYPFVKRLMDAHPGKIRLSIRYAPFHQGSDRVVMLLEAARRQGKFWETTEALLAAQHGWVRNHVARVDLAWGQLDGLGLDMERLGRETMSQEAVRLIEQDLADAQALNVTKTPEFFVNGRPLPRFGYDELKKLVEEEVIRTSPRP